MTAIEEAVQLAQVAARAASDKLATDIVLIDVSELDIFNRCRKRNGRRLPIKRQHTTRL